MWVSCSGRLPKMSDVSESLSSFTKNERLWVICSCCSEDMSDREQIAQVANQKWANEWIAHFLEQIAHLLIFEQKTRDSLGKPMSEFPALLKLCVCMSVWQCLLILKKGICNILCAWLKEFNVSGGYWRNYLDWEDEFWRFIITAVHIKCNKFHFDKSTFIFSLHPKKIILEYYLQFF